MVERPLLATGGKYVNGAEQGDNQPEQGTGPAVHECSSVVYKVAGLYPISARGRGVGVV